MPELIDRHAALEIAMCYCPDDDGCCSKAGHDIREMLDEIEALPTIEPEARHGEWHECWHTDTVCASICTNCGKAATQARVIVGKELMTNVRYPLSPNCGARMGATDTNVGSKGGAENGADA